MGRQPVLVGMGLISTAIVAFAGYALVHPQAMPAPVADVVENLTGANPRPVRLVLPPVGRLSALAELGRQIFYDPNLSASNRQACTSCHSPTHAYGPPDARVVQTGGAHMDQGGFRPPPTLTYLYRQQPFSIGPDLNEQDAPPTLTQLAVQAKGQPRAAKTAGTSPTTPAIVPQGGMFWDGRSDTLQMQANGPLMDPREMANSGEPELVAKLKRAKYADQFKPLFGPYILDRPALLVVEAMSAVARFQIEDPSFHAFSSKYDAWLQGRARLSPAELRGYRLFNDRSKANCGGCHLSQPTSDGMPPLFTDTQFEALGVPRNKALPINKDPDFFDMGLCGPVRKDLTTQTQYCGMFLTPTLRNVATRKVFFHNGVYTSLKQVLDFYNLRSTRPERIYPLTASGKVEINNDLPRRYWGAIDSTDAPFDRSRGAQPALTDPDINDIISFLKTLDDGYSATPGPPAGPRSSPTPHGGTSVAAEGPADRLLLRRAHAAPAG